MNIFSQYLAFVAGASTSNSIFIEAPYALVAIQSPNMEAGTAAFEVEASLAGRDVSDADALFVPVYKQDGTTKIEIGVDDTIWTRVQIDNPVSVFGWNRIRFIATDGAGNPVLQNGQAVVPIFGRSV